MPLAVGDNFAGFVIVRQLGSGGMGEVYLVNHPRLPRQEALKILPAAISASQEFRQRFNREAELAAGLWHPHIVSVHDRGEDRGQLWITMDYVEGTDAAGLLRQRYLNGLPPALAVAIVSDVADALDYAHERGLLHRDVKPANILLSNPEQGARGRRVMLSDFGIARHIEDASGLTQTNTAVGSILYAAPEQLTGVTMDGRADQYALAATAFQLLTGRPPFDNSNPAVVISSHLSTPPPRLSQRRPELAALDPVIATAMAKNPADRYRSCQEFAAALRNNIPAQSLDEATTKLPPMSRPDLAATQVPSRQPLDMHATHLRPAQPPGAPVAPSAYTQVPPPPAGPPPAQQTSPEAPKKSNKLVWIVAAAVVALLVFAGVVLVPTLLGGSGDDEAQPATTTTSAPASDTSSAAPTSETATSTTAAEGALITPEQANTFLMGPEGMSRVVGVDISQTEAFGYTYDTTGRIDPGDCAGAMVTGTAMVYDPIGYTGIHLGVYYPNDGNTSNVYAEQTVATAPTADAASGLLTTSDQQWQRCIGTTITNSDPAYTTVPQESAQSDGVLTLTRTVDGYGGPDYRCEHSMGVYTNLIAEALVCNDDDVSGKSATIVREILTAAEGG